MKVKVSEATGPVLNLLVAKALGIQAHIMHERDVGQQRPLTSWCAINLSPGGHDVFDPSTDWSQGGPIIEREHLNVYPLRKNLSEVEWCAASVWGKPFTQAFGPTPLIAAMRCYVTSKLGEEAEVPDNLGAKV